MKSIKEAWEVETMASFLYLRQYHDLQVQGAVAEKLSRAEWIGQGTVGRVRALATRYECGEIAGKEILGPQATKKALSMVKNRQTSKLAEERESKVLHGTFAKQVNESRCDRAMTHRWLLGSRLRAETEAFITAVQDGVILTAAYRRRVLRQAINPACKECHKEPETLGHLLSSCEAYRWMLFKEQHDCMLAMLLDAVMKGTGISVLECLGRSGGGPEAGDHRVPRTQNSQ